MDKTTLQLIGPAARRKIHKGVKAVADAIAPTLGPAGRSAILPRSYNRGHRVADDGYMVAENVKPRDEHERAAAEVFKEMIKKTNDTVGDGTTSTGIIGWALFDATYRDLMTSDLPTISLAGKSSAGVDVVKRAKEMKEAAKLVIEEIKAQAKTIESLDDLEKIAFISIKDEEIARTVAKVAWEIGRDEAGTFVDNHVDVVEGYKGVIETEVIQGMRFPAKVAHRAFVTNPERYEMVLQDLPVLLTNHKLDNPFLLADLIQNRLKTSQLAIFAPEFSLGVLTMLANTFKQGVFIYPVKCPALRTVQMEDLAVYTGAHLVDKDAGAKLENITVSDLGFAEKIVVKDTENREDATLMGGKGYKIKHGDQNLVEERREMLKGQLNEARNEIDRIQLEKRIANLSSAVAIIRVGAATDKETLHMKLKVEDGVFSCKAALQEGYVKGGGLCLKEIAEKLPQSVLTEALKAPYELIQKNAGGIEIGDDVIDPAKVVRLEVEHAVSIASTLIQVEVSMPEEADKTPADGYGSIAAAIDRYVRLEGKHLGLLKDNEDYAENERNDAFERAIMDADK